jgi:hypothetical protein
LPEAQHRGRRGESRRDGRDKHFQSIERVQEKYIEYFTADLQGWTIILNHINAILDQIDLMANQAEFNVVNRINRDQATVATRPPVDERIFKFRRPWQQHPYDAGDERNGDSLLDGDGKRRRAVKAALQWLYR